MRGGYPAEVVEEAPAATEEAPVDEPPAADEGDLSDAVEEDASEGLFIGESGQAVGDSSDVADPSAVSDEVVSSNEIVPDEEVTGDSAAVESMGYVVGWNAIDGGYYWSPDGKALAKSGWVITDKGVTSDAASGLQRYWLGGNGELVFSNLIDASDAGWWAYATKYGYVVRGKYAEGNNVYLADNDGKLENAGWVVSSSYGDGLQRYYIELDTHSAKVGRSSNGWSHYTRSEGYVARGAYDDGAGRVWLADNDGKLESATGWLVTSKYTSGELQRYYMNAGSLQGSAKSSRFQADLAGKTSTFFGLGGKGYVLRGYGLGVSASDKIYADNDGRLKALGWFCTDGFGDGFQRYWFDSTGTMARSRYISSSEAGYAAHTTAKGFVARGTLKVGNKVYLADNDGKLARSGQTSDGWVCSNEYGQGLQRYWVAGHSSKDGGYALAGYSGDGWDHYTVSDGYVLRGTLKVDGVYWHADNDGELVLSVSMSSKTADAAASGTTTSTFVGDAVYLFLPSYATSNTLSLTFNTFSDGDRVLYGASASSCNAAYSDENGVDLSALAKADGAWTLYFRLADSSKTRVLKIMRSANVSSLFIVSDDPVNHGRDYIEASADHSAKATGTLLVVDSNGDVVYNGALSQIKGRGNSSWTNADKKPYQIKLDKKTDLLQTGDKSNKAKTWTLITDCFDRSRSRNNVAYSLARLMGVGSAIDFDTVDLYYDGEYRGTYLLCEKVQVNSGRVDITDLEEQNGDAVGETVIGTNAYGAEMRYGFTENSPSDYTGGYLIEHEYAEERYGQESSWFSVWTGSEWQHFVVKSPEVLNYTEANYISCLVQDLFDAFNNNGVVPSWRGSSRAGKTTADLLDVDSMARLYWLNEITKNADGFRYSSTYFYKDSGNSKITFGPAWDFDLSAGNTASVFHEIRSNTGYYTRNHGLAKGFMKDPYVVNAINNYKASGIATTRNYLNNGALDAQANRVKASFAMNEVIWGTKNESAYTLRDWLNGRLDWLEGN